ncbi:hypothetical protein ACIKT0_12475 [Hansschlegelia beijingensis]
MTSAFGEEAMTDVVSPLDEAGVEAVVRDALARKAPLATRGDSVE